MVSRNDAVLILKDMKDTIKDLRVWEIEALNLAIKELRKKKGMN